MTIHSTKALLQTALFKAAKVGHISLMLELINIGADPFAVDKFGRDAFFYAKRDNPAEAEALLELLNPSKGDKNA